MEGTRKHRAGEVGKERSRGSLITGTEVLREKVEDKDRGKAGGRGWGEERREGGE